MPLELEQLFLPATEEEVISFISSQPSIDELEEMIENRDLYLACGR